MAHADLELIVQSRLALNLWHYPCLSLPKAESRGVSHHTQLAMWILVREPQFSHCKVGIIVMRLESLCTDMLRICARKAKHRTQFSSFFAGMLLCGHYSKTINCYQHFSAFSSSFCFVSFYLFIYFSLTV